HGDRPEGLLHPPRYTLRLLGESFAVCRLPADAPTPAWAEGSRFVSVTRTAEELSVVCPEASVPEGVRCERGWQCLRLAGTFELSQVGVLVALVAPLAEAGVSVFVVSTFDTDYLLVQWEKLTAATSVLRREGHAFAEEGQGGARR